MGIFPKRFNWRERKILNVTCSIPPFAAPNFIETENKTNVRILCSLFPDSTQMWGVAAAHFCCHELWHPFLTMVDCSILTQEPEQIPLEVQYLVTAMRKVYTYSLTTILSKINTFYKPSKHMSAPPRNYSIVQMGHFQPLETRAAELHPTEKEKHKIRPQNPTNPRPHWKAHGPQEILHKTCLLLSSL